MFLDEKMLGSPHAGKSGPTLFDLPDTQSVGAKPAKGKPGWQSWKRCWRAGAEIEHFWPDAKPRHWPKLNVTEYVLDGEVVARETWGYRADGYSMKKLPADWKPREPDWRAREMACRAYLDGKRAARGEPALPWRPIDEIVEMCRREWLERGRAEAARRYR